MTDVNQSQIKYDDRQLEENGDEHKFIIFSLGNEIYGARLLEVREVVEALPTKIVPNTISSFIGVSNLRGQIVGVLDLRKRFSIEYQKAERPVFLVFDTPSGALASQVDKVESVSVIAPDDIEDKPNIVSTIPSKFILGIGKVDDRMVTIIDLKSVLSNEELTYVENSQLLVKSV